MPERNGIWPETGAGGPKEIVVCLGCGAVSAPGMPAGSGFAHPLGCSEKGRVHGPTQTVSVLPASLADELAEALEEEVKRERREADDEQLNEFARQQAELDASRLQTILNNFHQAVQGTGGSRG